MEKAPLKIAEQVIVRHALEEDLSSLEWDGEFSHFRQLYRDVYDSSNHGYSVIWLADMEGVGIVGQIFLQLRSSRKEFADGKNRAYIFSFRVRSGYKRNGIGTLLLTTAEMDLRQRGFHYCVLNVSKVNEYAITFYSNFGYSIVAEEPGDWTYIDNNGKMQVVNDPSWRMEKHITVSP